MLVASPQSDPRLTASVQVMTGPKSLILPGINHRLRAMAIGTINVVDNPTIGNPPQPMLES